MDRDKLLRSLMEDRGWSLTCNMDWSGGKQVEFRHTARVLHPSKTKPSRLIAYFSNSNSCAIRIADFTKHNWSSYVDLCWPDEFVLGCMIDFDLREPDSIEKLESWLDAYGCKRLTTLGKVVQWFKGPFKRG